MYANIKRVAGRSTALAGAIAMLAGIGTSALPALASADGLNPLTQRSLTLSSSSPGWAYTDGSSNSTYAPPNSGANGQKTGNYFSFNVSSSATVKTMSFQYCTTSAGNCLIPGNDVTRGTDTATSSDLNVVYPSAAEVSGSVTTGTGTITLTSGSGAVVGSGTNFSTALVVGGTIKTAGGNIYVIKSITDNTHLTLTTTASASESGVAFSTSNFLQVVDPSTGLVKAVPGYTDANPKYQAAGGGKGDPAEAAKAVAGNFIVMYNNAGTWTQSTGWTAASQKVNYTGDTGTTNNYITLTNASGATLTSGQAVKILFFATNANYITNPGAGAFFVKINTYNKQYVASAPGAGQTDITGLAPATDTNIIDGGVTVANVMNQSIQITTKVLETMQFSVGTVDPDTLSDAQLAASDNATSQHQACDTILTRFTSSGPQNVLQLGNQNAESSLETAHTYATHSYWRLSSNSSAGATIYYSGHTLSNTSGDEITPIGTTAKASAAGSEQFGLALDMSPYAGGNGFNDATNGVDYTTAAAGGYENAADNAATGVLAANTAEAATAGTGAIKGTDSSVLTDLGAVYTPPWDYTALNKSFHLPRLDPLAPTGNSGTGASYYGGGSGTITSGGTAKFAFDKLSDTVPAPIATENNQVVDCVTGKMRYIGNIAATTPAGIYTTKVNYIAAPQY